MAAPARGVRTLIVCVCVKESESCVCDSVCVCVFERELCVSDSACVRESSEILVVERSRSVEVFGGLVAIGFASTWHLVLASIYQ